MQRHRAEALLYALALGSCLLCACQRGAEKGAAATKGATPATKGRGAALLFLSTQLNPVEEAQKMRSAILKDYQGEVDFRPNDSAYVYRQVDAVLRDRPGTPILLGALHGDFVKLYEDGRLRPLDDVLAGFSGKSFAGSLVDLGRLDGKSLYYIPWMQATYLLAVNKKALKYLPPGARIEALSYEQLFDWSVAILKGTGKFGLGFPAGEKGLMHRFLQGYLYPSFTGSALAKFRGADAVAMWSYMKRLWRVAQPDSLNYSTMAEPLLTEQVLIAWDHSARLLKAFEARPEDFVAAPAPIGPKGLGYTAVVSGLGIPKAVKAPEGPAALIGYLTEPAIQDRTLRETGFFPVVASAAEADDPPALKELARAVREQSGSARALPTLLPVGLGERSDEYNKIFMLAFSDIVLGGRDIPPVLDAAAAKLQAILDAEGAGLWAPDKVGGRPGKIE